MRAYDNGALYSVTVSAREVTEFMRSWPCSGLNPRRGVWFQFSKEAGDLVDIEHKGHVDGPALVALSEDALAYGAKRLRLADVLAIRAREVANYEDMMQAKKGRI